MSIGYGGRCKKILEDKNTVFYAYSGENLNVSEHWEYSMAYDGCFAIDKAVMNWVPSKPYIQTEFLHWARKAIDNELAVVITECRNAFHPINGVDNIAVHLLDNIFEYLHINGHLPDNESFAQ